MQDKEELEPLYHKGVTTGMVKSSSWLSILNLRSGVIYLNTIFDTYTAVVAGVRASVFEVVVVVF